MVDNFLRFDKDHEFDYLHFNDWHAVQALHLLQDRNTILTSIQQNTGGTVTSTGTGGNIRRYPARSGMGDWLQKGLQLFQRR